MVVGPTPRSRRASEVLGTRLVYRAQAWGTSCLIAAAGMLIYMPDVQSAEWRLRSSLGVRETYTDNIRLAPPGQEQSDWVTEVSPSIGITGKGARLQLDADYTFTYKVYANNDDASGHYNTLRTRGLLDVYDRKLFLQGSASIGQQDVSTLGSLSQSNVNLTANRTEVRQAELRPYWVSRVGNFANVRAGAHIARNESSGATQSLNSETRGVDVVFSSGPVFSDLGWSLSYSNQQIESDSGQFTQRELENFTANVRYRVWPTLTALMTVGRENNTYGNARGTTGGAFFTVGADWAPSPRTRVTAQIGERYYGKTALLDASHRTRLTTWQVSYTEQVVATPGLFSLPLSIDTASTVDRLFLTQFPDPIERQQVVAAYIAQNGLPSSLATVVNFLTNQVSLSKRLQGVFGLRGTRSSLLLSVYHEERESQTTDVPLLTTDPFLLSNATTQVGFSGVLSWRFSELTAGSASLAHQKSTLADSSRVDKDRILRLGLTHRLGPRLSGSLEYRFLERDSTAAATDARENAVVGSLSMTF